ncbi:hypothetical protein V6N11_037139 [Hibiscus sabdariffa]|uniref:Uncharacterized protein n=1 Tax=Hibiscus sabdariffa TaxID=183260 RepID=A0ABR2P0I3_9ROSI
MLSLAPSLSIKPPPFGQGQLDSLHKLQLSSHAPVPTLKPGQKVDGVNWQGLLDPLDDILRSEIGGSGVSLFRF